MGLPLPLTAFLRDNHEAILGALLLGNLLMLAVLVWTHSRLGRLTRLYNRLTRGTSGGNLEEILHDYMGTVRDSEQRTQRLEERVAQLACDQKRCLQQVGLVRFDAFQEVGGEQSFAVALEDAHHNGIILSSVFSRSDVRVYAKELRDGKPSHPLTAEEQQAMHQAEGR